MRDGQVPQLRAGEALHVTNGESAAGTLSRISLGGTVLPWRDVLHEGPLADVPAAELRGMRARFLAEHGWGEERVLLAGFERRDALLEHALQEGNPIVLWFEHDLYDQLQLVQVLAALAEARPGQVELVQTDDYLGSLDVNALEAWWERRVPVGRELLELGRAAWCAICAGDLEQFAERGADLLPHLAAALRRLQEERVPLSRTKRHLLEALRDGARNPLDAYVASQAAEDAIFLGDAWAFLHLYELAEDGLVTALPPPPPRGDHDAFVSVPLELTAAGRALLETGPGTWSGAGP